MQLKRKLFLLSSILVIGPGLNACSSNKSNGSIKLVGAGATFPAKIYTRWFSDLAKSNGAKVNYQAIGSGAGRKAFIDETVDFGASDDPLEVKDIAMVSRGVVQIPLVGGTIAFGYNNPDCELKLTQKQAVLVAIGKIKDWEELGCSKSKLTWVHRSDGSGTTKVFTDSMAAFSSNWSLGSGKSVKWPTGVGGKGNAGVAGVIRNTPGAIGYVNQSYIKGSIQAAALQNLSGEFIKPSTASGSAALNGISLDNNLAGKDSNPRAKGAYPISTLTWILAYETGNGSKAKVIQNTFETLLSKEYQDKASKLGFIPLRGKILEKSRAAIIRIKE